MVGTGSMRVRRTYQAGPVLGRADRLPGGNAAAVIEVGAAPRESGRALGVVALGVALALLVLPAALAIVDPDVLSLRHDAGWLGTPISRFAALQSLAMVVPFALGAAAVARDRARDLGLMAAAVALIGNFLLLRALLSVVVRLVLL
jgi:hypothetical protein